MQAFYRKLMHVHALFELTQDELSESDPIKLSDWLDQQTKILKLSLEQLGFQAGYQRIYKILDFFDIINYLPLFIKVLDNNKINLCF